MASKPILIIEDDHDIRDNLAQLLTGEGFTVLEAANGREALSLLRAPNTEPPALLFLDLMMPVMDGKTFIDELEADSALSKLDIPVVILTAATERFKGRVAGFMRKPLDIYELIQIASRYVLRD